MAPMRALGSSEPILKPARSDFEPRTAKPNWAMLARRLLDLALLGRPPMPLFLLRDPCVDLCKVSVVAAYKPIF